MTVSQEAVAELDSKQIRSVWVTNISKSANEQTLSDFFSFCGKMELISIVKVREDDTQSALVQFETEAAAKTALLLTNALIVDRAINVVPYSGQLEAIQSPEFSETRTGESASTDEEENETGEGTPLVQTFQQDELTSREHAVPDEQRSKTSTIASLIAAGYTLGEGTRRRALEIDRERQISQRIGETMINAAAKVSSSAGRLDRQLGISQAASTFSGEVSAKAKEFDDRYHISEKANMVKDSVSQGIGSVAGVVTTKIDEATEKALEYETVQSAVTRISDVSGYLRDSISDIASQSKTLIEKEKRERGWMDEDVKKEDVHPLVEADDEREIEELSSFVDISDLAGSSNEEVDAEQGTQRPAEPQQEHVETVAEFVD